MVLLLALGAVPVSAAAPASLPDQALAHAPVCPPVPGADAAPRCHAQVVVDSHGKPSVTSAPSGMSPKQFQAAYNSAHVAGSSQTIVAIVDAYNNPNALNDVNTYSSAFGLPQMGNCAAGFIVGTPCFQKVNQQGLASPLPSTDSGWALESSLDVQAVHAVCPDCSILLIEANSSSYADLMAAVDRAVLMGATVVSNSYGSGEFSSETAYDFHFNHPGVAFTVSSGDSGYGAQYPAASQFVTAVGGTTLSMNGTTYVGESAWSGAGSRCSSYESKPSFQTDSGCSRRMIADVSADANPSTGAAIYDSTPYNGSAGWFQVGGTSLASPLIAATYALGNIPTGAQANALPYSGTQYLHDVQSGSNGRCKRFQQYFCNAVSGYDGPTGLGTPNGTTAF